MLKKVLLTLLLLLPLTALPVYAQNETTSSPSATQNNVVQKEVVILGPNEVVNKDYFAAGERVVLNGTVNGDAYLAGGNIVVNGTINGDLLVAGGQITIRGKVSDDVRAAGGQILVEGEVGKNLTTAGGNVNIAKSASVAGNLVAGTGSLTVAGNVGKDATIGAGAAIIESQIGQDVLAGVGELSLMQNANVKGNLTYWSQNQADIQPEASVSGTIKQNIPPAPPQDAKQAQDFFANFGRIYNLISLASALLIGLLLLRLWPVFTESVGEKILVSPWKSLGIGFLVTILLPFALFFFVITVIGIPIAMLTLIIYFLYAYFAKIFIAMAVGLKIRQLSEKKWAIGWFFLIGLIIYAILTQIPVIGFFVSAFTLFAGIGSLLLTKQDFHNSLRAKKLI